jgi:hypothetical protein
MHQDPIVEEIHQACQALLDQYQGNIQAYFASLLHAQTTTQLQPTEQQVTAAPVHPSGHSTYKN